MMKGEPKMPASRSNRTLTETVLIWSGMLTGLFGAGCLAMGVGGVIPTSVHFALIGLDIQTSSVAFAVVVVGFAVALATLFLARITRRGVKAPALLPLSTRSEQLMRKYRHARDAYDTEAQRILIDQLSDLNPTFTADDFDRMADNLPDDIHIYMVDDIGYDEMYRRDR